MSHSQGGNDRRPAGEHRRGAQVTNFHANLPGWAALSASTWNRSNMFFDDKFDPLPLLNTFNVSSVNPTKKTKRLPSGAFGQYGECGAWTY